MEERQQLSSSRQPNVGPVERWLSVVGGVGLFWLTRCRAQWWTKPLALGGGMLVERGISGYCPAYQALGIDRHKARGLPEGRPPARRSPPQPDPVAEASEGSFPASDAPSW